MFVGKGRVDVVADDDTGNTITIIERMNYKQRSRVERETLKVSMDGDSVGDMELGAVNLMLLKVNIVAWRGPAFDGVPCTEQKIEELDPDEPLIEKVLAEINTRNKKKVSDPLSGELSTSNGVHA